MDFQNTQPQAAASARSVAPKSDKNKFGRITNASLFGAVAVLLIALVAFLGMGGNTSKEAKFVDSGKLQAVFLQTGQVYFGKLKITDGSYVLSNIYYLQTSSTGTGNTASSNVSLVKLGCELHEPYDQMVVNHSQITFWENLQDNGQVAKAVATFVKNNPNGQKCTDQSTGASTTGNTVQGAATTKP